MRFLLQCAVWVAVFIVYPHFSLGQQKHPARPLRLDRGFDPDATRVEGYQRALEALQTNKHLKKTCDLNSEKKAPIDCSNESLLSALDKNSVGIGATENALGLRSSLLILEKQDEVDHPHLLIPFKKQSQWKKQSVGDWKGEKVLSLGEGYSGFVAYLRASGVDATGLDIDYHTSADKIKDEDYVRNRNLVECNRSHLKYGDATKFVGSDFPPESFDHIVSDRLLCCLREAEDHSHEDLVVNSLVESLKVLKKGGSARFTFTHGFGEKPLTKGPQQSLHQRMDNEFSNIIEKVKKRTAELGIQFDASLLFKEEKNNQGGMQPTIISGTLYIEKRG